MQPQAFGNRPAGARLARDDAADDVAPTTFSGLSATRDFSVVVSA
jgi:hypothetical protein